MIRTSPATYYRAAATVEAAVVLSVTTRHASAQTLDLFAGSSTTPSLTLNDTLGVAQSASGPFGPTYNGTVTLTVNAVSALSETFNPVGASNNFVISQSGVANVAGTTSATKTFTGTSLSPGASYALTLTRTANSTLSLGNVNLVLSQGSTNLLTTGSGDVLSLFGATGTTDTFNFTVPATAPGNLTFTISSTETASLLGGSYTFSSASINQVPEPRTTWATLLGVGGLTVLRFRRRLRAAS